MKYIGEVGYLWQTLDLDAVPADTEGCSSVNQNIGL